MTYLNNCPIAETPAETEALDRWFAKRGPGRCSKVGRAFAEVGKHFKALEAAEAEAQSFGDYLRTLWTL